MANLDFIFENNGRTLRAYQGHARTVVVPDSVREIAQYAFQNNPHIRVVKLSEGVASVGAHAFANCKNLKKVLFANSVSVIGTGAFQGCSALTHICLPYGKQTTEILSKAFCGCSRLRRIVIPANVHEVHQRAFAECTSLRHVVLCGVHCLGANVFAGSGNLTIYRAKRCSVRDSAYWNRDFNGSAYTVVTDAEICRKKEARFKRGR